MWEKERKRTNLSRPDAGPFSSFSISVKRDQDRTSQQCSTWLEFFHRLSPPAIHRNLKANNILLTLSLKAKLSDFGTIRAIDDEIRALNTLIPEAGTSLWRALETFHGQPNFNNQSTPVDIYALAITMLEVLDPSNSWYPVGSISHTTRLGRLLQNPPWRPAKPQCNHTSFEECFWDLNTRCWPQQPGDRLTIDKVLRQLVACWLSFSSGGLKSLSDGFRIATSRSASGALFRLASRTSFKTR